MSTVYLEQVLLSFPRPIATLLRRNGSEFPGGCSVNKINIPHPRRFNMVRDRADNTRSGIEIGTKQHQISSIEVDAYSERCVEEIYEQVGRAESNFQLMLERPPMRNVQGYRHLIEFFYEDFTTHFAPVFDTRTNGGIQLHRAVIENIRVKNTERFG